MTLELSQSIIQLYDLMSMGFKYQILGSRFPHELIQVTKNHITSLKGLLGREPLADKLDGFIKKINEVCRPKKVVS